MGRDEKTTLRRMLLIGAAGLLLPLVGLAEPPPASQPAAGPDVDLVETVNLVPVDYRHRLVQQLGLAEDNQQSLLRAIAAAAPRHRGALAYLLVNMPEKDLKTLKGDYLLSDVRLAYKAREATAWGRAVPEEIFFNDVLPYANTDERRDDWRQDFYDRFLPLVKETKTPGQAVQILNKQAFKTLNVKYHPTKRDRPIQSPYESVKIGYASCTGLSILLADACRAVGEPARVVGTPMWSDKTGNHTWTEVWDRQWHFVGSAEPGKLDKTWFVENAAKADKSVPENHIFAVSFRRTDVPWFLVLDAGTAGVYARDVTDYYLGRKTLTVVAPQGRTARVIQNGTIVGEATGGGTQTFTLPAGGTYTIATLNADGKVDQSRDVEWPKDTDLTVDLTKPR